MPAGQYLKQIILKQIKPIDNLLILSFSLSSQFGQQKKNVFEINFGGKYDFKWFELILVANMSFNGLTPGLKTVCNKPKPSLEVTQKLKR